MIYSLLNNDELAINYYEKAIKEFYEFCKISSVKISKKIENRIFSRMKRLGSTTQELKGFNIDEDELELEMEMDDKFDFGKVDYTDKLDTKSGLIKIKKYKLENPVKEYPPSEKVTKMESLNKDQSEFKEPTLKLISIGKDNIDSKTSETTYFQQTKTFMGKEIVEEIVVTKDSLISDFEKEKTKPIEPITTEYSYKYLKEIANEAISLPQINSESTQNTGILKPDRKQSIKLDDDFKNTGEYINQLQNDYKNILWQKEKMDEERDELERAQSKDFENTQKEDAKSITAISEDTSDVQFNKLVITDPLKQLVPNVDALKNLDQITSEPQTNKIPTEIDATSSNNETIPSITNESKSSNTFTIK